MGKESHPSRFLPPAWVHFPYRRNRSSTLNRLPHLRFLQATYVYSQALSLYCLSLYGRHSADTSLPLSGVPLLSWLWASEGSESYVDVIMIEAAFFASPVHMALTYPTSVSCEWNTANQLQIHGTLSEHSTVPGIFEGEWILQKYFNVAPQPLNGFEHLGRRAGELYVLSKSSTTITSLTLHFSRRCILYYLLMHRAFYCRLKMRVP